MRAYGRVKSNGRSLKIRTSAVVEWSFDYGERPGISVRSKNGVWYLLKDPAEEYVEVHKLARKRFELCFRIFVLCTTETKDDDFETSLSYLSQRWKKIQDTADKTYSKKSDSLWTECMVPTILISCELRF